MFLIHIVIGILIAGHGSQKLFGFFGGFAPAGTGQAMESLGLRPGTRMALAAGVNELVGGVLLALGLLVPVATALIGASYLVAARTAHRGSVRGSQRWVGVRPRSLDRCALINVRVKKFP